MDLEPLWMIYYAETAFIFCLVQLLNTKLASSVWHVWQTPLWSVHPTGCKGPAGSANSSWHYSLLILIRCAGILDILGKDELAQEEGGWEGGDREKGGEVQRDSCLPASQDASYGSHIPAWAMEMLSLPVPCPQSGSRYVPFDEWTNPKPPACQVLWLGKFSQNHLPWPVPRLLSRSRAFSPVTGFLTSSFLFIVIIAWPLWTPCVTPV